MSGHLLKSSSPLEPLELSPGGEKYLPREMTPEAKASQAKLILEFVQRWKAELEAQLYAQQEAQQEEEIQEVKRRLRAEEGDTVFLSQE